MGVARLGEGNSVLPAPAAESPNIDRRSIAIRLSRSDRESIDTSVVPRFRADPGR
jgi:hypothetical protein